MNSNRPCDLSVRCPWHHDPRGQYPSVFWVTRCPSALVWRYASCCRRRRTSLQAKLHAKTSGIYCLCWQRLCQPFQSRERSVIFWYIRVFRIHISKEVYQGVFCRLCKEIYQSVSHANAQGSISEFAYWKKYIDFVHKSNEVYQFRTLISKDIY